MRNLTRRPSPGPLNTLQYWPQLVHPLRVVWNFICIYLAKYSPSLWLKCVLYRMTGMKVGKHVSFGLAVVVDIFYPHLVTIKDNATIGYNSVILCHEFLTREYSLGPVVIEEDVMIGANSTILAGVTVGRGATVSAMSLVNDEVAPGALVGGVPARLLHARDAWDIRKAGTT